jgi:putative drug exporter of the RND superfamily
MKERFGAASAGSTAQVVFETSGEITDPAIAGRVARVVRTLGGLPGVQSAGDPVPSRDQRAAISTVSYAVSHSQITDAQRDALQSAVTRARGGGLDVEVRGDATRTSRAKVGGKSELIGVVVALLVPALTYGWLIAAGMNLLTAIVGVAIGALGITTLTGFVDLQSTTPILAAMLGLAWASTTACSS